MHIVIDENWVRLTCNKLPNRVIAANFTYTPSERMLAISDIEALQRIEATHKVISQLFKELGEKVG